MGVQKNRNEVFKCNLCGQVIEVMHGATGTLYCCNQEMVHLKENTVEASAEKHIPVLTDDGTHIKVSVGAVAHPMDIDHFIEWIEVINGDYVNRMYLKPGFRPEASFYVHKQPGLILRAYCNKHGLWKA
ncbi:MAG TPA: desulfoferrodoxin [Lentisphaeria bacterium]|nr:MAG: desulfoferrodoxin [Lentisphaerae bacterium GWF2_38_69]HBM17204.1 desulfoferrodoxin [Lentisphaeria bacterium]